MLLRIFHFFFGHRWSGWVSKSWDKGYYDEENWRERTCGCGAKEELED